MSISNSSGCSTTTNILFLDQILGIANMHKRTPIFKWPHALLWKKSTLNNLIERLKCKVNCIAVILAIRRILSIWFFRRNNLYRNGFKPTYFYSRTVFNFDSFYFYF